MTATAKAPAWRRDLWVTLAALALLLAWDASGLDLAAARLFGTAQGFAWEHNFIASRLLHDGGRVAALVLVAGMVAHALWPVRAGGPSRRQRWAWVGVTLLTTLLVPAIKRISSTSCPWSLSEFGGTARYLSHWQWGVPDGASGHCFPSGHAVAAFAFFSLYFLWRGHNLRLAHGWLVGVLVAGALFGAAQLARGAHYPSHTLWSAWLCWALCVAAAAAMAQGPGPRQRGGIQLL
jgi:membrane-associated PAP2 superfamily phosphatase